MTIDFTCQKCEGSFELDAQDLIDGTEKLECPHCGNKAPPSLTEDFSNAIAEMRTQLAALSKKFTASLALESEDVEELEEAEDEDEEETSDEDEDLDLEDEEDDLDDEDEDEDYDDDEERDEDER
jgi:DNA-directed RNA polymerase subunit RPC12/RpoP